MISRIWSWIRQHPYICTLVAVPFLAILAGALYLWSTIVVFSFTRIDGICWNVSGTKLAWTREDNHLSVIDWTSGIGRSKVYLEGGQDVVRNAERPYDRRAMFWSPDDLTILSMYGGTGRKMHYWHLANPPGARNWGISNSMGIGSISRGWTTDSRLVMATQGKLEYQDGPARPTRKVAADPRSSRPIRWDQVYPARAQDKEVAVEVMKSIRLQYGESEFANPTPDEVRWNPGATRLLAANLSGWLWIYDTESDRNAGRLCPFYRSGTLNAAAVSWSPDSSKIAVLYIDEESYFFRQYPPTPFVSKVLGFIEIYDTATCLRSHTLVAPLSAIPAGFQVISRTDFITNDNEYDYDLNSIHEIGWSRDSRRLACAFMLNSTSTKGDKTLQPSSSALLCWSVDDGALLGQSAVHSSGRIAALRWHPDLHKVALAEDFTVKPHGFAKPLATFSTIRFASAPFNVAPAPAPASLPPRPTP